MICPLYQSHDEKIITDREILFEKVANKRALKPEIFNHTHFKITAYINGRIFTEEQLYEKIYPTTKIKGSKTMVLSGDPGTGKSELCSYFRKELIKQDLGKYLLYLDKSASLYDIITDRLPKFYKQATGKKLEIHSDSFENMQYSSLSAAEIMMSMLAKLNKNLLTYFDTDFQMQKNFQKNLTEAIKRIFQKDTNKVEARGLNPFDAEQIIEHSNEDWMRIIKSFFPNDTNDKLSEKLNEAFSHAIYSVLRIPPFSSQLKRIAMEIGRKIWIIFEDYEMPYLDNKEILSFAESDQTEIDIQFVIALIPDRWENFQKMLTKTFTDRSTLVEFKKGNENFLNSKTCIQFIEKFLTYHKKYYPSYCLECKKCSENIKNTFPMNEIFLKRIFDGSSEADQNPRKYVEIVGAFLEDLYKNNIPPFNNKHLLGKIRVIDIPADLEEGFQSLSSWYFITQNNDELKEWCKIFNIKYEVITKKKTPKTKSRDDGTVIIDEKYDNLRSIVRNYLEYPSEVSWQECGDFIQQGLNKVLDFLTDDHSIQCAWPNKTPPSIIYHFPGKQNILSLTKKKDTLSYNFDPLRLPMHVGEELLNIGYNNSFKIDTNNQISIDLVQFIIPMISDWRNRIETFYCSQKFGENDANFDKLILLCYKLLQNFKNPFNQNNEEFKITINGRQYIKNTDMEKLGEKLIKFIKNEEYISELCKWRHSIGGEIYLFKLNEIINPWDEIKHFQKAKVGKILDSNIRYKHSGQKVELSTLLHEIFIFSKELNDKHYSKEIVNNQFTQISKFISNITEKNINKIKIASDLSNLDGKQIKSVLRKISESDFKAFTSLKKMVDIFLLEKNEGLRAIQVKYLFNIELYSLLIDIISDSIYINKSKNHITLIDFCEELITDNEKEKGKKEHEEFEKQKKRIIVLIKNIEILEKANEIKDGIVKPDLTTLKNIEDIQKYISILEQKWRSYIQKERDSLENLDRLNDIFKILTKDEMNMKTLFNEFENNPSIETLNNYIEKRNTIHDKLKDVVPTLGTEKVIKLLKGEKILFSNLNKNEVDDIFRSKLKEILSIGLGNK
jgi:hypothetical protein